MADGERTQAQRRRASGRQQRRSLAAKPFEELDQSTDSEAHDEKSQALATARKAAGTAAAAALAGALAGGAKALVERNRRGRKDESDERPHEEEEPRDEPTDAAASPAVDEQGASSSPEPQDLTDDEDDDPSGEPSPPQRGASSSEVSKMIEEARSHVRELLGDEPESVSGIEAGNGSWAVTLEVVEVHRVPDTTDVLASYEVVLDDDGDLVRLERKRRYFRSQVEEGS